MYITKVVDARIVAAALRSVCNQVGPCLDHATAQAVGHLAGQLMMGYPLDAAEGSIAAEYIEMITDNLSSWTYRVEVLGY